MEVANYPNYRKRPSPHAQVPAQDFLRFHIEPSYKLLIDKPRICSIDVVKRSPCEQVDIEQVKVYPVGRLDVGGTIRPFDAIDLKAWSVHRTAGWRRAAKARAFHTGETT